MEARSPTGRATLALFALGLLSACIDPGFPPTRASDAGANDAQTRDGRVPSDAGDGDAHADQRDGGDDSPHHSSCKMALDAKALESAFRANDALQKSKLNEFAGFGCNHLNPLAPCTKPEDCPYAGSCLHAAGGKAGYCVSALLPSSIPALLGYQTGQCRAEINEDEKAALCCAHAPGVDCRLYPFTKAGAPGMYCGSTDECELGLVCRELTPATSSVLSKALGVCECPETTSLTEPPSCAEPATGVWGQSPPDPLTEDACWPALEPGFVEELVSFPELVMVSWIGLGTTAPLTVDTPSGAPAFLYFHDSQIAQFGLALLARPEDMPQVSPAAKIDDFASGYALYDLGIEDVSSARAAFGSDGSLHVVSLVGDGTPATLHSSDGSTTWHEQQLPKVFTTKGQEQVADLVIDASGNPHVLLLKVVKGSSPAGVDRLAYLIGKGTNWEVTGYDVDANYGAQLLLRPNLPALAVCNDGGPNLVELSDLGLLWWDNFNKLVAVAYTADTIAIAVSTEQASIEVYTFKDPRAGAQEPEQAFRATPHTDHFGGDIAASMDIDAQGAITIAHNTPQGISITRKENGAFTTRTLSANGGSPTLRRDPSGKVAIYYPASPSEHEWGYYIRRLREGTCPP